MDISDIRVLHITNSLDYGGVEKIIYQLCGISKDVFKDVKVASTGGVYVEKLQNIGVEHFEIPDLSSKKPTDIVNIISKLTRVVIKYNINVIHCHHRMAVLFAKLIPKRTKILYNNHTIYSDKPIISKYILKNINIIADGVMAQHNVCDYFGIDKSYVTTINNAVDAYDNVFEEICAISESRKKGEFIVMNSARLHPQKGMHYFIDAAEILIKKGYPMAFYIVGDGPLKDELALCVEDKNLSDSITFLGFRKDIKNTISQCDVLVLTSVYEGLPLTPMEAFSVNKAVIATDIDGTREVIVNNYNGLLAETENPVSIAEKIERVYLNRKLLDELGHNAFITYNEKFSIHQFAENYLNYYEKL